MSTEKQYQAHELRVIEEKKELDEKLEKLTAFTKSPKFRDIVKDDNQASLLIKQRGVMSLYSSILKERIDLF